MLIQKQRSPLHFAFNCEADKEKCSNTQPAVIGENWDADRVVMIFKDMIHNYYYSSPVGLT